MTKTRATLPVLSELFWFGAYTFASLCLLFLSFRYLSRHAIPVISNPSQTALLNVRAIE